MIIILVLLAMFSLPCIAQDGQMPMPENEERFKQLVSLRITTILVEMDLSAQSEKGAALFDLLTRESNASRDFHRNNRSLSEDLRKLVNDGADAEAIGRAVQAMDDNKQKFFETQLLINEELKALFNTDERARYYVAESKFRNHLERLLRSRRPGGGPPNRMRNR